VTQTGGVPALRPGVAGGCGQSALAFHLDTANTQASAPTTSHDGPRKHACWDEGLMTSSSPPTRPALEGPQTASLIMGYYTRADLEFWYALADAFTIAGRLSLLGHGTDAPEPAPSWSGTLDPEGHEGGPVIITNSASAAIGSATWRSMPEELEAKGISWKVYTPRAPRTNRRATSIAVSDNIFCTSSASCRTRPSLLYKRPLARSFPNFAQDVANDTLPQVSWIIPR